MQILDKKLRGRADLPREKAPPGPHARKVISSDARGGRQMRRGSEPMDHGGAGFAQHERRRAAAARRRLAHLAGAVAEPAPTLRLEPCAAHLHPGTAVVVGGMVLDVTASPAPGASLRRGSSTPGVVRQNPGGVGRNIAEGIARLVGPHGGDEQRRCASSTVTASRNASTTSWNVPSASWGSGPTANRSRSCGSSPCPSPSRFEPTRRSRRSITRRQTRRSVERWRTRRADAHVRKRPPGGGRRAGSDESEPRGLGQP